MVLNKAREKSSMKNDWQIRKIKICQFRFQPLAIFYLLFQLRFYKNWSKTVNIKLSIVVQEFFSILINFLTHDGMVVEEDTYISLNTLEWVTSLHEKRLGNNHETNIHFQSS